MYFLRPDSNCFESVSQELLFREQKSGTYNGMQFLYSRTPNDGRQK